MHAVRRFFNIVFGGILSFFLGFILVTLSTLFVQSDNSYSELSSSKKLTVRVLQIAAVAIAIALFASIVHKNLSPKK